MKKLNHQEIDHELMEIFGANYFASYSRLDLRDKILEKHGNEVVVSEYQVSQSLKRLLGKGLIQEVPSYSRRKRYKFMIPVGPYVSQILEAKELIHIDEYGVARRCVAQTVRYCGGRRDRTNNRNAITEGLGFPPPQPPHNLWELDYGDGTGTPLADVLKACYHGKESLIADGQKVIIETKFRYSSSYMAFP